MEGGERLMEGRGGRKGEVEGVERWREVRDGGR